MIVRVFLTSAIFNGYYIIVNKISTLKECILIVSRIAILTHDFAVCLISIMSLIMVHALLSYCNTDFTVYTIEIVVYMNSEFYILDSKT